MSANDIRQYVAEAINYEARRDYYGLLGVSPDATADQIAAAYRALTSTLDPVRLERPEYRDLRAFALRILRTGAEAVGVLSDPARRSEYDQKRIIGVPEPQHDKTPEPFSIRELLSSPVSFFGHRRKDAAERVVKLASIHYAKGEYFEAEVLYSRAHELDPENPTYEIKMGWSALKNTKRPVEERLQKARRPLERGAARAPYDAEARYAMATYWREANEPAQYRRELEATLRCDRAHEKARKELSELDAREQRQRAADAEHQKQASRFSLGSLFRRAAP